jgi:GSH-dependent disulfide-bond oxidoreductase
MFDLYGMASPNVTKVRLLLEELDWPYQFHWVRVFRQEQFSAEFRKLNPNGKVPVLVDNDAAGGTALKLFESGAILLYLAEKSGMFLPTNVAARFEVMQWLMIQLTGIGPMFGQHTHFKFFAPSGNDYSLQRYVREIHRYYKLLDQRLAESPFLGGNEYSIADINLLPWVSLFERQDMDLNTVPHVQRWFQLLSERAAVKRTFALTAEVVARDAPDVETASAEQMRSFLNQPDTRTGLCRH